MTTEEQLRDAQRDVADLRRELEDAKARVRGLQRQLQIEEGDDGEEVLIKT